MCMSDVFQCPKCGSKYNRDLHYKKLLDMQSMIVLLSCGEEIKDMCGSCNYMTYNRDIKVYKTKYGVSCYLSCGGDLAVAEASFIDIEIRPDGSYGDVAYFNRINVPSKNRGVGIGRDLLVSLLDTCKDNEIAIILDINPYGDLTYEQLESWYKRYGFKEYDGVLWYIPKS